MVHRRAAERPASDLVALDLVPAPGVRSCVVTIRSFSIGSGPGLAPMAIGTWNGGNSRTTRASTGRHRHGLLDRFLDLHHLHHGSVLPGAEERIGDRCRRGPDGLCGRSRCGRVPGSRLGGRRNGCRSSDTSSPRRVPGSWAHVASARAVRRRSTGKRPLPLDRPRRGGPTRCRARGNPGPAGRCTRGARLRPARQKRGCAASSSVSATASPAGKAN
jgi:hypothetical protein